MYAKALAAVLTFTSQFVIGFFLAVYFVERLQDSEMGRALVWAGYILFCIQGLYVLLRYLFKISNGRR